MINRVLITTSVEAERQAVLAGFAQVSSLQVQADVVVTGVGIAAAAACTATELTRAIVNGEPYHYVICAGIGGAYPSSNLQLGDVVIGSRSIFADLGAEEGDGSFIPLNMLGFGAVELDATPLRKGNSPYARIGPIATVSTATGTKLRAELLLERLPEVLVEAMEGYGVATAATIHSTPWCEVRAISNYVGPRDRDSWNIPLALQALTNIFITIGEGIAKS